MNKIFSKLLLGTIALTTANASWADLAASTLPVSRSVQVGAVATAFATLINSGNVDATGCRIELGSAITADFFYQATDPATNQTVGAPDTPVNIAAGAAASFIFGITPTMTLAPTNVELSFVCNDAGPAPSFAGLNTLLLSASTNPVVDIIGIALTATNDGLLTLPNDAVFEAFAAATVNVGAAATVTARARAGFNLNGSALLCETNPVTGACVDPPATEVNLLVAENATPTFSVFVSTIDEVLADFANNRVFLEFLDAGGDVRGSTSVAVTGGGVTPSPDAFSFFQSNISEQILAPICTNCHTSSGIASGTRLVYLVPTNANQATNFATLETFIQAGNGQRLRDKPIGNLGHGGGVQLNPTSALYGDLLQFIVLVEAQ